MIARRTTAATFLPLFSLFAAAFVGCASSEQVEVTPEMLADLEAALADGEQDWHRGPDVFVSGDGPARYAGTLYEAFHIQRAMRVVRYADGFYREPANEGYDLVLDRVRGRPCAQHFFKPYVGWLASSIRQL